jgi:signal transduction histidine kinase
MLARSPLELVACDLNAVVASALSLIRHQFERRGISLEAALAAEPPVVWGDSVQLQQLLLNLLLNAADACDGLGVDRRRVEVRTAVDNAWALLTVADAGKGIEPSVAERLFDAFCTTKPEGLGIGLSISRSITDRHGGTLTVTSNKDCGVTFVARVRLASSTASTAGPNDTKRGSGVASCSPEHSSP